MARSWNPLRRRDTDTGPKSMVTRDSFTPFYPFDGLEYPLFQQTLVGDHESIAPSFLAFLQQAYRASPIIYACIANRIHLFSEARFQYRERRKGRPGDLFGDQNLRILERPWPGGTTGDLLALAELHVSCAGNFFAARRGDQLRVMRPDWTAIVSGSPNADAVGPLDLDAEVIGYLYQEGGAASGKEPVALLPSEVCHYMPMPDGEFPYRGMSWITPVIRELVADKSMTSHKHKYLEAGATPNLAVKLNVQKMEEFNAWVEKFREAREGSAGNPYQTLFLSAAADPVLIGSNLDQLDFAKVQAGGETRIAAAAMVHPAIAAFSDGLQGSALNAGNLAEVFRQFANHTMRPLWRNMAGSLEPIITVPPGAELWFDDRDVPALQEDVQKLAAVTSTQASTVSTLFMAGADWDAAVDAVVSNDLSRLKGKHSGLPSVQVQPAGANGANNQLVAAP